MEGVNSTVDVVGLQGTRSKINNGGDGICAFSEARSGKQRPFYRKLPMVATLETTRRRGQQSGFREKRGKGKIPYPTDEFL